MPASRTHHSRVLIVSLLFIAGACSGGSGLASGCGSCLTSGGPYVGPKEVNAVSARISGAGFDYLNSNWQVLLGQFLDGGTEITIPVSCLDESVSVVGDVYICDQNFDQCASGETCPVTVNILNFNITPATGGSSTQGIVNATATLDIETPGGINVDTATTVPCFGLESPECAITLSDPQQPLSVPISFSLDSSLDPDHPVLQFSVGTIQGISSIDSNDLNFSGENTCGDAWCGLANLSFIKSFLISQLEPTIEADVQNAVAAQECRSCGAAGDAPCPVNSQCNSSGVCMETCSPATSITCPSTGTQCVPRMLGLEGSIAPGAGALGAYGVNPTATLEISAVAGGSVDSEAITDGGGGLTLGVVGGANSARGWGSATVPYVDPCVPTLVPPTPVVPPLPNFDVEGAGTGYEIGLGVSQYFLNQAAFEAQQSGAICIALSGEQIQLLNTGLLQTFLPSLQLVAGSPSESVVAGDAPLLVTVRPLTAPEIDIGAGTYDPQTLAPIDPLITLTLNNLDIDMYALIEDRWVRLFSLGVNVQLPLSLIVDGCPTQTITPALGSLTGLITVSTPPSNSEILAEDPSVLQGLIPAVISLAQPALAGALKPIAIPSISGFTVFVDSLKGISQNGNAYNDIGLFGSLYAAGQMPVCDQVTMQTIASIAAMHVPTVAQLHPPVGSTLPLPVIDVAVSTPDTTREAEFGYRIDDGLWSPFLRGPMLHITDARLLIEGHHNIAVRARPTGHAGASDPNPVQLDVLIDYEPPVVRLTPDSANNTIRVGAKDNVTAPRSLQFRYTLGGGEPSDFGAERPIDLKAVTTSGSLTVDVRDEAGNVGTSTYHAPTLVAGAGSLPTASGSKPSSSESTSPAAAAGCTSSGGPAALLPLLLLPWWRRRR